MILHIIHRKNLILISGRSNTTMRDSHISFFRGWIASKIGIHKLLEYSNKKTTIDELLKPFHFIIGYHTKRFTLSVFLPSVLSLTHCDLILSGCFAWRNSRPSYSPLDPFIAFIPVLPSSSPSQRLHISSWWRLSTMTRQIAIVGCIGFADDDDVAHDEEEFVLARTGVRDPLRWHKQWRRSWNERLLIRVFRILFAEMCYEMILR